MGRRMPDRWIDFLRILKKLASLEFGDFVRMLTHGGSFCSPHSRRMREPSSGSKSASTAPLKMGGGTLIPRPAPEQISLTRGEGRHSRKCHGRSTLPSVAAP